ncbi:MAG: AEC family transporter [Verrucomicrobiae bacterium]|nr:AEC family transporter [Verrucomicrobiae bacterium]
MILEILRDICLPLLLVMGLGWGMDRRFRLNLETLVKLNLYLFVPAFIFVRLSTSELSNQIGFQVIGFTLCIITVMGAISWLVAKDRKERIAMQLGTMFYNSGNWGIPLMALAFPRLGPVIQVFVLATMNVSMFTLGITLAGLQADHDLPDRKVVPAWRRLLPILRQPSIYAILAAIVARRFDNPIQEIVFIWKPLGYLADTLVGFALTTLGVQLSQTRPPRVGGRLAWALGIRLLGGPLAAVIFCWFFGFRGEFAAILIVGAASPTAVNAALVTHEFKGDSRFAAAVVFYTTLMATGVVTLLLAVLRAGWIPWAREGW